ncbi:hypothetical protein ACM25O_13275 [Sulfitobacter pontiacus]
MSNSKTENALIDGWATLGRYADEEAALRDAGDASLLYRAPGHPETGYPRREAGSMPTLQPGQLGGIAAFMAEAAQWGFDPKIEGPARCNDQFDMTAKMTLGIEMAMLACHSASFYAGWWHDKETGALTDEAFNIPVKLMLIVSEVSEAMEGDRKGLMDDKLTHRPMFEVELADVFIRLMDLAGATQCDLAGAVVEKMAYNAQRPDHKVENRKAGGKAY